MNKKQFASAKNYGATKFPRKDSQLKPQALTIAFDLTAGLLAQMNAIFQRM